MNHAYWMSFIGYGPVEVPLFFGSIVIYRHSDERKKARPLHLAGASREHHHMEWDYWESPKSLQSKEAWSPGQLHWNNGVLDCHHQDSLSNQTEISTNVKRVWYCTLTVWIDDQSVWRILETSYSKLSLRWSGPER